MKKIITSLLVLFIFSTSLAIADGFRVLPTTIATPLSDTLGCTVTFTNPHTNLVETRYVGTIVGKVKPKFYRWGIEPLKLFMSLEIDGDINYGDSNYTALHPYYLNLSTNIKNEICGGNYNLMYDTIRSAALQLAIWHYTDNLNISTIVSDTVRYWTTNYCNDTYQFTTYETLAITFPHFLEPDQFFVEGRWWFCNGGWCPCGPYYVSTTEGVLSDSIVYGWSDSLQYNAAVVTISGASNGAVVTAKSKHLIPSGIIFENPGYRKMIFIGFLDNSAANGDVEYSIQWGVLPVELSSFTSIINQGNVTLNWITTSETNNSEFQVERKSDGTWETIGYVEGQGTTSTPHVYQFIDRNIQSGKYSYRLMQIDYNGNFEYHNLSNEVVVGIPEKFELKQNYPNPFNPKTRIEYTVPYNGIVTLIVYDINGREISSLVKESKQAGYYSVDFYGSNLSSGIYYYRLIAGDYKVTKRMMLIK